MKISSPILKKNATVSFDSILLLFPLCWYYLAGFCTFKKKRKQQLKVFYIRNHICSGRGYSISKRLVKITKFQGLPLQLPIARSTSVIICVESSVVIHWLGVHQCKMIWRLHLSGKTQYLKYWFTLNSAKYQ